MYLSMSVVVAQQATQSSNVRQWPQSWLNGGSANWNHADMKIPAVPASQDTYPATCRSSLRPPTTPEDRRLMQAGWMLFGPLQVYGRTSLITAAASFDGMCRPMHHQAFVFHGGNFIGILSPKPMDSRFDGDLTHVSLPNAATIMAEYRRYAPSDPACCPSGTSSVVFSLRNDGGRPVLIPGKPSTSSNE